MIGRLFILASASSLLGCATRGTPRAQDTRTPDRGKLEAKVAVQTDSSSFVRLEGSGGNFVSFSPDGELILTAGLKEQRTWDARTLKPVGDPVRYETEIGVVQFCMNGKAVFTATADAIFLQDARTKKMIGKPLGISGPVLPAAITPDGSTIATTSRLKADEAEVEVWDASSGRKLLPLHHAIVPEYAAFTPDGSRLLTVEQSDLHERTFHVWDLKSGRELFDPIRTGYEYRYGPDVGLIAAAFSPDGKRLVVGEVKWFTVFDAWSGKKLASNQGVDANIGGAWYIHSAEFTPDGTRILAVRSAWTALFDAATGQGVFGKLNINVYARSLSPDGKKIICVYEKVEGGSKLQEGVGIWDLTTGEQLTDFPTDDVWAVAFSPDGRRAASSGRAEGHYTTIWNLDRLKRE
jgi:WD40 repeat protein